MYKCRLIELKIWKYIIQFNKKKFIIISIN